MFPIDDCSSFVPRTFQRLQLTALNWNKNTQSFCSNYTNVPIIQLVRINHFPYLCAGLLFQLNRVYCIMTKVCTQIMTRCTNQNSILPLKYLQFTLTVLITGLILMRFFSTLVLEWVCLFRVFVTIVMN